MTRSDITILVVEDDREVREIALAVLEGTGYRVLEAASGDDAHRLLLTHPDLDVDVLFTDLMMPGRLDGIELADAAAVLRPGLQVLFTSGFTGLLHDQRDIELHGPVLRKPYRPADLRRAIERLVAEVT